MTARFAIATLAVVLFSPFVALAADPLTLIADKSKISFLGKKPDGEHKGGFKKFKVDAVADHEDMSKSSIKIEIETDSLWSDDEKLTGHLKNADFFDVKKYPKATFESTKIEKVSDTEAKIHGKMTMLDKTEELVVPVKVDANDERIQLNASFKLDRTKWGMNYGKGKINDEVEMTIELAFKP
jgi:polyisoprenoid-binding protein YceI